MRILLLALGIGLAGSALGALGIANTSTDAGTVSYPVERDVTDYADFTGRTAAVDSVEARVRLAGYLDRVYFKEGCRSRRTTSF